jgi:hypothetical protein
MLDLNGTPKEVTYPVTSVQITPNSIVITTAFGPGKMDVTVLDEQTSNEMVKQWILSRKNLAKTNQLVKDVMRNKGN